MNKSRLSLGEEHVVLLTWGVDVNEEGEAGCSRLTRLPRNRQQSTGAENTTHTPTHIIAKASSERSTECQQTQFVF